MVIDLMPNFIEESTESIVIKAFATWCTHCNNMKPIFEQLEKKLGQKYIFAELNIEKYPELTQQLKVSSLPTFIFIKDKKEVGRIMGEVPQSELEAQIKDQLG